MGSVKKPRTRRSRFPGCVVALLLFLVLAGHQASGQSQQEQVDGGFSERLSVDYILVPVVVRGPRGTIDDLEPGAFELLVDGAPTQFESFESGAGSPFNLFFLQDLSGSMELVGKLRSSRRILNCFLDNAGPGDRFALFSFAGKRVDMSVPLTHETRPLREAARAWRAYGTTALHDAIAWLPSFMVESASTKRAILLVSDGLDNASEVEPGKARERIRASEVPVYVIGLGTGSPFEITPAGKKRYRYADVMNLLAHLSGGSYYSTADQEDLDAACASVLADLRHQYILGFSAAGAGESAPRSIEVRVRRKNVKVSHRRSYSGRPPVATEQ